MSNEYICDVANCPNYDSDYDNHCGRKHCISDQEVKRCYARKVVGMLKVSKCPSCDGSGAIFVQVDCGICEAEQCRWCYEYSEIFDMLPNGDKQ